MFKRKENFIAFLGLVVVLFYVAGYYIGLQSGNSVIDETVSINRGSFTSVSFSGDEGTEFSLVVRVSNGQPIDLFIVSSTNYDRLVSSMTAQSGSFDSSYTMLDTHGSEFEYTLPGSDIYYLVLNNAGGIPGGATPFGESRVYVKINK